MSEYIIKGTSLTNIADGIRSVDGSSGVLTPAQMAARLNTVKSSIDSALSALAGNGVEVPSGSTVHTLAELIAGAGSGSASGFAKVATGTITPSSDLIELRVDHELGVTPNFALIYLEGSATRSYSVILNMKSEDRAVCVEYISGYLASKAPPVTGTKSITFRGSDCSFRPGGSYRWIAGVFA